MKKSGKDKLLKTTKSQNIKKKREKLVIGNSGLPINEHGESGNE